MENSGVSVVEVDKKIDQNKEMNEILKEPPMQKNLSGDSFGSFNKIIISIVIAVVTMLSHLADPIIDGIVSGTNENGKKTFKGYAITGALVGIIALVVLLLM
jgi:hypothetical protein